MKGAMTDTLTTGFIGGGAMGEAILSAILKNGLSQPRGVCVSDVSESRRQYLEKKYNVAVTGDNRLAAANRDVVILAIKPQNSSEVLAGLNGCLKSGQVVLSIIAGTRIDTLCQRLNHQHIVRAMPNTPAQIGEGMSAWTATTEVTDQQKSWARSILDVMGKEIYFDDEKYLDMATAVSGSGPAYFFLFVDSLIESAIAIGLPPEVAEVMILQTMLGSGRLIQQTGKSPAELRRMVTSPGGTTAAALLQFEKGEFNNLVRQAVTAAFHRAKELGS